MEAPVLELISEWGKGMLPLSEDFKFHHYGLACKDLAKTAKLLEECGYTIGPFVNETGQKVVLSICLHPVLPCIEIVFAEGNDNPIHKIIEKKDMRIYHTCYEVPNRHDALQKIRNQGYRFVTVSPAKNTILFNGDSVSFHFIKEFDLFEILEKKIYEE